MFQFAEGRQQTRTKSAERIRFLDQSELDCKPVEPAQLLELIIVGNSGTAPVCCEKPAKSSFVNEGICPIAS